MQTFINKVDDVIPKLLKLDRDTLYDFKITKHREKRSLDANAYYWTILGQIADVMKMDKEELHKDYLKHYGVRTQVMLPVKGDGYFKYYDLDGIREVNGNRFYVYNVYKQSSEMNTKEMSKLIDGIVQEAKTLDIKTMTPNELQILKEEWK